MFELGSRSRKGSIVPFHCILKMLFKYGELSELNIQRGFVPASPFSRHSIWSKKIKSNYLSCLIGLQGQLRGGGQFRLHGFSNRNSKRNESSFELGISPSLVTVLPPNVLFSCRTDEESLNTSIALLRWNPISPPRLCLLEQFNRLHYFNHSWIPHAWLFLKEVACRSLPCQVSTIRVHCALLEDPPTLISQKLSFIQAHSLWFGMISQLIRLREDLKAEELGIDSWSQGICHLQN